MQMRTQRDEDPMDMPSLESSDRFPAPPRALPRTTACELRRFGSIYGASPAMGAVFRKIERVAPSSAAVLIFGESGSGKELVARTIHTLSARSSGPFVAVNCGAIPATLIEAEVFGHMKGAFTGAAGTHKGHFERAAGGTLLLDEITEMPTEMQVRLLRVLETGRFARIGGEEELHADVRVVAATNRDPVVAVRDGCLREDLYYRLAVFPLRVPPLRDRGDDVDLLARHFLAGLNVDAGAAKSLSRPAQQALRAHRWPGNVRELRNAIQRAFILADETIEPEHLALAAGDAPECEGSVLRFAVGTPLAEIERRAIFATLGHCRGHKRRCADMLGVSVRTLYNRLSSYAALKPAPDATAR